MRIKIGINGFGRIGRCVTRLLHGHPLLELAVVNSRSDIEGYARLLRHDSSHGRFPAAIEVRGDSLDIGGNEVRFTDWSSPAESRWGDHGVRIVVESTGKFTDRRACAEHLRTGADKVVISAPGKETDLFMVYGVNHDAYDHDHHQVVSCASCTTNALAPTVNVLDEEFGLVRGLMTTIHSYTMSQRLLDGSSKKDPRRGRAAALSQVPTSTGAAKAVIKVLPQLAGRLDGMAVRVPTHNGSLIDLVCDLERAADAQAVNEAFKRRADAVLGYSEEPLVSVDYIGDTHAAVVDGLGTMALEDGMVKVLAWYDNEMGFSAQLVRCLAHMAVRMGAVED